MKLLDRVKNLFGKKKSGASESNRTSESGITSSEHDNESQEFVIVNSSDEHVTSTSNISEQVPESCHVPSSSNVLVSGSILVPNDQEKLQQSIGHSPNLISQNKKNFTFIIRNI
jgi:hypothetical protein